MVGKHHCNNKKKENETKINKFKYAIICNYAYKMLLKFYRESLDL